MYCKSCGKNLQKGCRYCPSCGQQLVDETKRNIKTKAIVIGLVMLLIMSSIIYFWRKSSPIDGVSRKVYNQGMMIMKEIESLETRGVVISYVLQHEDDELDDIYLKIDNVKTEIKLSNHPTDEEKYFVQVITKFWEARAICYAHEGIMAEYEDSDEKSVEMALAVYKGIVAGFEDKIEKASEEFEKATNVSDMKRVYKILENIWNE